MLISESINYMPSLLKAFKKYIEKYECSYMVTPGIDTEDTSYALIFYHATSHMPYLLVCQNTNSKWAAIYVNKYGDNLNKATDFTLRENCYISNDMKAFLEAIHLCAVSK